jgi:hypothetical protein
MSQKAMNITGWVLTIVLALLFAMSAFMKLSLNETAVQQAAAAGMDAATYRIIGVVEILSLLLFLVPRTGLLGAFLLIAYMGGAIATHLQHQQPIAMAIAVQVVLWIATLLRHPELKQRLVAAKS